MNFWKEFKTFITKGNVMDMAVGVIIGGMFTKIVNSVVNDILMPFISLLTGRTSFENMLLIREPPKMQKVLKPWQMQPMQEQVLSHTEI